MFESLWKRFLRRSPFSLWQLAVPPLWILSLLYRPILALNRHMTRPLPKLSLPVLSIGNISVGGTGKTPLVEFVARFLQRDGLRVGIVSSGWGRKNREPVLAAGYQIQEMSADDVGDEVALLAEMLPEAEFSVDRVKADAAVRLAETGRVDLVIVDDGFQHWRLPRDLDIVAFDAAVKEHQWHIFPLGRLREPLERLAGADVLIVTRSNFAKDINALMERLRPFSPHAERYHARFTITGLVGRNGRLPSKFLRDKRVTVFAGIGNFRSFRKQVAALCSGVDATLEFSDHQSYTERELTRIASVAREHDSDMIITTGKDWVKLGAFDFGREICYVDQSIDLDPGEERLIETIARRLALQRTRKR